MVRENGKARERKTWRKFKRKKGKADAFVENRADHEMMHRFYMLAG